MSDYDERGYKRYWDRERETMKPAQREKLILERMQHQLHYVYEKLPFYRRLYDEHGFKPDDVGSVEDFTNKVPVVRKKMLVEDQKRNPKFGSYAGDFKEDDIIRIQGSSGTSGTPTLYRLARSDWERAADVHAMAQWCAGIRPNDIVQVGFSYSLFFGGWGVNQGSERLGATVFPLGAVESERHLDLMFMVGSTVFSGTPSYCLHIASVAERRGLNLADGPVKRLLVGGEAGGSIPSTKGAIQKAWGASCHDCASTSEMYPFQSLVECDALQGMHAFTDEVYVEVVNKEDANQAVPRGTAGAVVYTHLWRESQPMIRFWPGDETIMIDDPCSCGRTYPRLPRGVIGRLDDMLIIRGVNVYPSAVEEVVRSVEGLGPEFLLILEKRGALDEATIQAEWSGRLGLDELSKESRKQRLERLSERVGTELKRAIGLRMQVVLLEPGTLPPTVFKARRVVDRRANTVVP